MRSKSHPGTVWTSNETEFGPAASITIGSRRSWTAVARKRHHETDENRDEDNSIKLQDTAVERKVAAEQKSP